MHANPVLKIKAELVAAIDRWTPEVVNMPARSTMRTGIAQKCYLHLDRLLEACVDIAIGVCPLEGADALLKCGEGKPRARFTFGQRAQVLAMLDECLATALPKSDRRRLLGKDGLRVLQRLSKKRSLLAHYSAEVPAIELVKLFVDISSLCESPFMAALSKL